MNYSTFKITFCITSAIFLIFTILLFGSSFLTRVEQISIKDRYNYVNSDEYQTKEFFSGFLRGFIGDTSVFSERDERDTLSEEYNSNNSMITVLFWTTCIVSVAYMLSTILFTNLLIPSFGNVIEGSKTFEGFKHLFKHKRVIAAAIVLPVLLAFSILFKFTNLILFDAFQVLTCVALPFIVFSLISSLYKEQDKLRLLF